MGRRSLPKLDPTLDLSRHYFELESWPEGRPITDPFAETRPLHVEIGSGKGLFLSTAAEATPDRNFVGIEIARKYAQHAAARLARRELPNAIMLQGDGEVLLRDRFADGSLEAVHVYFPDPWWKTRHRKRRLMNPTFVRRIETVLEVGGELHFWTDVEEYFQVTLELLGKATDLEGPFEVPEKAPEHDLDYQTHFERRMRQHDQPIYRSRFRKSNPSQSAQPESTEPESA